MISIENLFDWLLEEIFLNLSRRDRLVCKEVCKRWNCILMERQIFIQDRHIFIATKDIKAGEAPMSVLMKAANPYEIYSVKNYENSAKNLDLIELFKLIGPFIKEFTYKGFDQCGDIFSSMPSLKYLTLDTDLTFSGLFFQYIRSNKPSFAFHNLERIQLSLSTGDYEYAVYVIKFIKEFIPENCSVIFPRMNVRFKKHLEHFCLIMDAVTKINEISVSIDQISQTELEKLLEVNVINCDKFSLDCESQLRPYRLLEELLNKHPNLREFNLTCHSLPPIGIYLSKLVRLKLKLSGPLSSLKPNLEQLTNLKELVLEINENECDFVHESLLMPKLNCFEIYMQTTMQTPCPQCLDAIANSFVNLKEFTLRNSTITWNQFKTLIVNWKSLQNLYLVPFNIEDFEEDFSFDPNENLRSFKIDYVPKLSVKTVKMIVESFCNLEILKLYHSDDVDDETMDTPMVMEIIKAVVPVLPKLNSFSFDFKSSNDSEEYVMNEYEVFCEYMDNIGFPLQNKESGKETFVECTYIGLKLNRSDKTSKLEEL